MRVRTLARAAPVALCVLLAAWLVFANSRSRSQPPDEATATEWPVSLLADSLRARGWLVSEVHVAGDRTVVVFTDIHADTTRTRLTCERVKYLAHELGFVVVGIEGWTEEPGSAVDVAVQKLLQTIQTPEDTSALILRESGSIVGIALLLGKESPAELLFRTPGLVAFGLEADTDLAVEARLAEDCRIIVRSLIADATSGRLRIVSLNRKVPLDIAILARAQTYLRETHPDFPVFDILKFEIRRYPDGPGQMVSPSDTTHLKSLLVEYTDWLFAHALGPRNLADVDSLLGLMFDVEIERASLLVGTAHVMPNRLTGGGASVTELLAQRNVSYIVVDPLPQAWRLETPAGADR